MKNILAAQKDILKRVSKNEASNNIIYIVEVYLKMNKHVYYILHSGKIWIKEIEIRRYWGT